MSDFLGGIVTAWRKPLVVLLFSGAIFIPLAIFSVAFYDINMQAQVLIAGHSLREHNAVVFERVTGLPESIVEFDSEEEYDAWRKSNAYSSAEIEELVEMLGDGRAYTFFSAGGASIEQEELLQYEDRVIFISGSKLFSELYPQMQSCEAPCVMVGQNVDTKGYSQLTAGGLTFPIEEKPLRGVWFEPFGYPESLDSTILVLVPADNLEAFTNAMPEPDLLMTDIFSSTIFVGVEPEELTDMVSLVAKHSFDTYLIPESLASSQSEAMSETMTIAAMFMVTSFGLLGLVFTGLTIVQWRVVKKRSTEFVVRGLYGASRARRFGRILGFLSAQILFIPLILLVLLAIPDSPMRLPALVEAGTLALTTTIVSFVFARLMTKNHPILED